MAAVPASRRDESRLVAFADGVHSKINGSREKWYTAITLDLLMLHISNSIF
jgi:hypothetical protein